MLRSFVQVEPYGNTFVFALFHMVHWIRLTNKKTAATMTWSSGWVQELAQYYCFGVINTKHHKTDRMLLPAWILKHWSVGLHTPNPSALTSRWKLSDELHHEP